MNGFQPFPAGNGNGTATPSHPRSSVDMSQNGRRTQERDAMPMPVAGPQRGMGMMPGEQGFGPMGLPRSPPKNKNTHLVPCKFFLQGTCQAGRTCPFSHDLDASTRPAPCKYFAKGGCKFGRKCMLLHITPDGHILNRPGMFAQIPPGQPFAGPPPHNGPFQPPPPGLLSLQAQGLDPRQPRDVQPDFDNYPYNTRNGYDRPQIDMTYTSASPTYGSPPHDSRFANSPPVQGLSVLDAPLPNSFDSNGISMAARNGPFAASVPSRFGVESPPASLPRKAQLGNTALRDLHNSAFGGRGMDGVVLAGSSPPSGTDEELTFPKLPLHSERLRDPRHQIISASLGTKLPTQSFEYSDDEDVDENGREDLLPASLRDLFPDRKFNGEDENTPASFLAAQRRTISGPQDGKFGSPHSSSPSRYTGTQMRSYSGRADWESQVGSPLRNASSYFPTSAPRTANGDLSPTVSSPPQQASMSILTKELQRTKLDATNPQTAAIGMIRTVSNGSTGRTSLDRALSTNSVRRERIDEEQELFDMDEVGDASRSAPRAISSSSARSSGQWSGNRAFGSSPGNGEPTFGAIGSHRTAK